MVITVIIAIASFLIAGITFLIQYYAKERELFTSCAKSLYSDKLVEQITAAIMLRDYVGDFMYASKTKNVLVALLRTSIPVALQKVVADVFSYAKSLTGQDMQHINMLGALIKPKSCVQYQLTNDEKYKNIRLPMEQVDCYHAIIKDCSLNFINAQKAVFYCANLSGTVFHNCLLDSATFKGANVRGVRFDKDCVLEGANFQDAEGLEQATWNKRPILDFLDANGIFHAHKGPNAGTYVPRKADTKIFISKLGVMDLKQKMQYDNIINIIENLQIASSTVCINRDEYPIVSQLSDIEARMDPCDGCVIFACEYMQIADGCLHKDIDSVDRKPLSNVSLVSPWLHIEAAIANSKNMPCLIIYDKNLFRDGMFDPKVITSDRRLYAIEYSDALQADNTVLQEWRNSVREYYMSHN